MGRDQSVAWVIVQVAETLAAEEDSKLRRAGRALPACEVLGFRRVDEVQR